MSKTLGQVAHDTGAAVGGWARKWEHMADGQRAEWEAIAAAVLQAAGNQALLEALQDTFAMLETRLLRDTFGSEWVDKARAAIATATQEESGNAPR